MERVLCIVSSMNAGGAETFLMKLYRAMDREQYQMDFCVNGSGIYDDEIKQAGGKIYVLPLKSKHPFKAFFALKKVVKENGYNHVIRVNEHSLSTIDLLAAKFGGAKVLAMRSSNASSPGKLSRFLHKLFFFLPRMIPNVKIAPSAKAAEYTFGKRAVKKGKVHFLHNAIDLELFRFDQEARLAYRQEFDVADKFVVGHVGRFNTQKNHAFLLDIFAEIKKCRNDAVLVLVGKGNLEQQIKEKIQQLALEDSVIFTGVRSDVPKLLSMMDVFVFPSFYEGMPNTVIEAQATGLPCVISDTITREANITGLVTYVPLKESACVWAKKAVDTATAERLNTKRIFMENRYDIQGVVEEFINLIFHKN